MSAEARLRAAARLKPRMVAYHVKRLFRNKAVRFFPGPYEWLIQSTAKQLPLPLVPGAISSELAQFIGAFYSHSEEEMENAARGRFTILGRTADFGSVSNIDWLHTDPAETDCFLWRMKLAQLEIIHSLISSSNTQHHKAAETILNSFVRRRSFAEPEAFATAWSPYDTSHRLLALLSGLSLAKRHGKLPDATLDRFQKFARLDAAFLWRNIEHEMRNNHTERNLAALCLYHLASGSISPRHAARLDHDVDQIIRTTVLDDGMQAERSAMYQGLTVMALRIFSASTFLSSATRQLASDRADAAARAWLFLTHRDGEIALFNDSWFGEVPPPNTVIKPASFSPAAALPAAGYFRLSSGSLDVFFDAGDIGLRWNPAHGHPDLLSLELDVDGKRFLVDPGTSQYSTGPRRNYERSSTAHNGPHYSGIEAVEYVGRFKVGRHQHARSLPASALSKLSAPAVGGFVDTKVGTCSRVACSLASGGILVVDYWSSRHPGVTNILIAGNWAVAADEPSALKAECGDSTTTLTVYEGQVGSITEETWSCRYFVTEKATSVHLSAGSSARGQRLVFGVGIADSSEVLPALAEIETILREHPKV